MATQSSVLSRKIPWTEEPGGLQSTGRKELDMTERRSTAEHGPTREAPRVVSFDGVVVDGA